MIYLGQPYSHPDPDIRLARYMAGTEVALALMAKKKMVFAPITHWHHAADLFQLPFEATYWAEYNHYMLNKASALYALLLDGWQDSKGLFMEVSWAHHAGKPVFVLESPFTDWKIVSSNRFVQEFTHGEDNSKQFPLSRGDGDPLGR